MSRIIVKGLSKYITEDGLRGVFSTKGEITDVKLMRLCDGRSRQFAFIGFRKEEEAQEAITYFNHTYIDTLRISVEVANPPPSSFDSLEKEGKVKSSNANYAQGAIKKPEGDDPRLQELLEDNRKFWSNDMFIPCKKKVSPVIAIGNKAKKAKKNLGDDASDMEYFKSKIKKNLDSDDETDTSEDVAGDTMLEVEADCKKSNSDDILNTGRIFVLNLPYTTTEEELLMKPFSNFGEISEVHLVLDQETKRSKGMAYILYRIPESAARAMEQLDNQTFQGRLLRILPAKHREKQVNYTCNIPKTFKQKREEQRKASEAGGNTKAWNSLFMRPDTILENIARMYCVKKSELLDRESEDPAVRLALGETKVIAETKEAFAKAGVNVTSLEEFASGKGDEKKNRSNHILLVKNLPFASTEKELAQMFGKYGSLDKIILPPTKTMALVVFLEPAEARAAMKNMAYKCFKYVPLFLEWAPGDILEPKALVDSNKKKIHVVTRSNFDKIVGIDSDITESNVLYVKNLSFETTEESLKKQLTELVKHGKILSVKIIKHVKKGKCLSTGYGFVEFDSIETATSVYRDLQETVLDGYALKFRFCENKQSDTVGKGSDKYKTSKKLLVKNVAFEATSKDLRQLFSQFAQITRLGYPKRNSRHAGFAFIEFETKQEALNARKSLSGIHLHGRPLVLEWAKDDNSMKAIRVRSAAKYIDQEYDNPRKLRRCSTVVSKKNEV
ncbi:multiple RNA-binding domain-containing protein 1 [Raphanus sativus]|uniref:Multiple RNA-binding domain-containing protein 1 n=1 Tax=Raphanus sativus TaxID=3726 RepID=A0A9W3CDC2_RAPSA|nr:multiple RNA-binding domain-containing protein 1 [Raphanus sativus]